MDRDVFHGVLAPRETSNYWKVDRQFPAAGAVSAESASGQKFWRNLQINLLLRKL